MISDFKFFEGYNTLVARDYFNLYVWDLRKPNKPVKLLPVFSQMNRLVNDLIESSRLDDRFKLDVKGSKVLTSFYGNTFHLIDINTDENIRVTVESGENELINKDYALEECPEDGKPRELSFHPDKNEIAVTYRNRMDIYNY